MARVEACNRRFVEMLGVASHDGLPTLSKYLRPQDQSGLTAILRGFENNLAGEPPATREWRLEALGAEPRLLRCDFHWIQETGQVALCLQDVTAQRRWNNGCSKRRSRRCSIRWPVESPMNSTTSSSRCWVTRRCCNCAPAGMRNCRAGAKSFARAPSRRPNSPASFCNFRVRRRWSRAPATWSRSCTPR